MRFSQLPLHKGACNAEKTREAGGRR